MAASALFVSTGSATTRPSAATTKRVGGMLHAYRMPKKDDSDLEMPSEFGRAETYEVLEFDETYR